MRVPRLGRASIWSLALVLLVVAGPTRGDRRFVAEAPLSTDARLELRLGNAPDTPERPARTEVAPATVLSARETERVLARLPALPPLEGEEKDFALRESSLPPPRTGVTLQAVFPPAQTAPRPETAAPGPLAVARRAPEGEIPIGSQLSVTFSQPMVAVTSHADLAKQATPLRIEPQPAGSWRWVGTKTLLFEASERFPMATEYRVTVPAGTRSALGSALAKEVRWTFATPAPTLVARYPEGVSMRRKPVLFAAFDQRIDPAAMLASIRVGTSQTPLRLATPEEVKADPAVSRLAEQATAGRWLAFVPRAPLPADAAVAISVGIGAPSAEGPRRTAKKQDWTFRTFGPLRVLRQSCGSGDRLCAPGPSWWSIAVSNPLDAEVFTPDMVRVTPALRASQIRVSGTQLVIQGEAKARTSYRVKLSAALADAFGQTLGKERTLIFQTGTAETSLQGKQGFVVLDPAAGPRLSFFSTNVPKLSVRAYTVAPQEWPAFSAFWQKRWREPDAQPPGRLALSETVPVHGTPDELTETSIDLAKAFPDGLGHAIVVVEPSPRPARARGQGQVVAWVQATRIGLDAFVDASRAVAWVSSLADGKPLADCDVSIDAEPSLRTGSDGVAAFELPARGGQLLVARCGRDVAVLPEAAFPGDTESRWRRQAIGDTPLWYVFDDRQLYRPGETVKIKGWIRRLQGGPQGDVAPLSVGPAALGYTLRDSQGNEISRGTSPLNAFAGFELSFELPATMNLGPAYLALELPSAESYVHELQVQEFRRPEFEVSAAASAGPHVIGGHADVSASAAYYAGGALQDAEVSWTVSQTPGTYTPPNRDDYTFGVWRPWWELAPEPDIAQIDRFAARTDAAGRHALRIGLVRVEPPQPMNLDVSASVMDVNRQAWAAGANLLVHPSTLYVGLRSERLFVQRGETLEVDAIVTDIDGKAVPGRDVQMSAERLEWKLVDGAWKEAPTDVQTCRVASASDAVRCSFAAREGGVWRVSASVADDAQRRNRSEIRLWVAGGKVVPARDVTQQKVELVPDRKEYRSGEVASVLVLAPFAPAEGMLTLRRSGLLRHERFRIDGASHTLRIPIEEGFTPNLHVQVDLIGAAPSTRDDGTPDPALAPRPAFAAGSLELSIPPLSRTLALAVKPRDAELEPGSKTTLDIDVTDGMGRPVADAELAVVVVDEAILSLSGYRIPDPIATFYTRRDPEVRDHHLRASVVLGGDRDVRSAGVEEITVTARKRMAFEAADLDGARLPPPMMPRAPLAEPAPIRLRTDFSALALFAGSVPTDARGRAQIPVTLPDSLTRYRVMVAAVTQGNQFGKGEATLTARLPLMVRPSAPRFLNFGDRFELPVVVQNQTNAALQVDVAVRAANAELAESGKRVVVPARDRVEVRFAAAARKAGTARFQIGGVAPRMADAAVVSLPVWTPATTEAFATYGQLDAGSIAQPVSAPADVVREFGGLELTTSSTALQSLTDALLDLVAYPYECAEQLASRVLAVAALKDVLGAFQAEGLPSPQAMVDAVERDLQQLERLQNEDGGFAFWRRGDRSWPYVSIHVAHAIERARAKGFAVPPDLLTHSRAYLKDIDRNLPKDYGAEARQTLRAYALYVLQRMGERDVAGARTILRESGVAKLPLEALGWLLSLLSGDTSASADVEAIRRHLASRATETASTASFSYDYGEQGPYLLLHSNRRTDAVLLEALIQDQPQSDLIPKLVEGLLAQRRRGHWQSTQENAFVLLALDRYFATYERATPDFVARAWLGDRLAAEETFRGRNTDRRHVEVPMRTVSELSSAPLVLAKDGPGRLYYRIGMQYAPASLKLDPSDQGFVVERSYEAADDPADVRRDADGTWHVRAGSRVRVRLSMVAESRRYHVALVDPLPAGLEPLNPALATTGALPPDTPQSVGIIGAPGLGTPRLSLGSWWWWRRVWFDHQNLRDDRVEAFASLLWEGVYTYTYFTRATTPGTFIVPPTKAEEMYHPETFGRTATDRVIVE